MANFTGEKIEKSSVVKEPYFYYDNTKKIK